MSQNNAYIHEGLQFLSTNIEKKKKKTIIDKMRIDNVEMKVIN